MKDLSIISYLLGSNEKIPNNPTLPLLIYKNVVHLPKTDPASEFEKKFQSNRWDGSWRDKIYSYHHYHSNNHEVLGVYQGKANVLFGGDNGIVLDVQAGDVIVIPAGVAHKCLSASEDFSVVGAYSEGNTVDECLGHREELPLAKTRISQVLIPALDPIFGRGGPLTQYWK